jgi:hypothetical protein
MRKQRRDPRFSEIHLVMCQCALCAREKEELKRKGHYSGEPLPKQLSFADTVSNEEWLRIAFTPDYRH